MMTTMLTKIDKKLKEDAQKTAASLGLPLSTIINNYLKTFVMEQEVTFKPLVPNAKTVRAIRQAKKEYDQKKTVGGFDTTESMMKSLNS